MGAGVNEESKIKDAWSVESTSIVEKCRRDEYWIARYELEYVISAIEINDISSTRQEKRGAILRQ